MKTKYLRISIIALILSFIMFMLAVPEIIWTSAAEEIREASVKQSVVLEETDTELTKYDENSEEKSAYIITEAVEKRTANTKEFIMSDDTIMVQHFTDNVHYLENGEYKEIDNSLIEEISSTGERYYRNVANSLKVKLYKNPQRNSELVELEEDGYKISFGLKNEETTTISTTAEGLVTSTSANKLSVESVYTN